MGNRDAQSTADHAAEENRERRQHLDRDVARLELLRGVAFERGPVFRTGNDIPQLREHLATVADPKREGVGPCEEGPEHVFK